LSKAKVCVYKIRYAPYTKRSLPAKKDPAKNIEKNLKNYYIIPNNILPLSKNVKICWI